MWFIKPYSSSPTQVGQTTPRTRRVRTCASVLLLFAVGLPGSGCTSIYHRTLAKLPPEPAAELKLRVGEAREAEVSVKQAAVKLREHLDRGTAGETLQVDFDRLEAAAFELERRVLAARESLARCVETAGPARQIESLQQRAGAWQDYVRDNRQAGSATQLRQLDVLLRGSAPL